MSHMPSALETRLNLKAMTLLIVDSNDFSRSFTRNVCVGFRFDKILTAGTPSEALDHMVSSEVQLMLADWLLLPGSGEMLIRNVRRIPAVRNPFVPIIALSGTSDRESVALARDAGANEFMQRPFDLKQLLQRFAQVLLTPRPFIRSANYVGPDRRRRQMPFDGEDRRVAGKVAAFKPSTATTTAAKAAAPGGSTLKAMAVVGEKIIAKEEVRYRDVRRQDLDDMTALFEQLRLSKVPNPVVTEQIYLKSHALKSMGQTFGFPLLTEAGDSLCRMLWKLPPERTLLPLTVQGIEAHVRTMKLIVDQDIRHDGGEVGAQLVDGLRTLQVRIADDILAPADA